MELSVPAASTPRLVLAVAASEAPVPPSVIGTSVPPAICAPAAATLAASVTSARASMPSSFVSSAVVKLAVVASRTAE